MSSSIKKWLLCLLAISTPVSFLPASALENGSKNTESQRTNTITDDISGKNNVPDNSMVESEFTNSEIQELTACALGKFSQADFAGAAADFKKAIKLAPKRGELYLQYGLALLEMNDFQAALNNLNTAYNLDRTNRHAILVCRGRTYHGLSDYKNALSDFDAAIKVNAKSPLAFIGRADTYQTMGEDEKALSDLEEAIRLDPDQAEAYFLRSKYYHHKNLTDLAVKDFDKAVTLDKVYLTRHHELRPNQHERSTIGSSLHLGKGSQRSVELIEHGLALYRAGNHLEAIHALTEALEDGPDCLEAFKWRAMVYMHMSSFTYAIEDLDRAIAITPGDPTLYATRAKAYLELGNAEQSINDYSKAITLSQTPPHSLFEARGLVYSRQGKSTKAIEDFDKAIQISPDATNAYLSRGLEFMVKPDPAKAIADFTKTIDLNKNSAVAYKFRGQAKLLSGDKPGALNDLQHAVLIYDEQKDLYGSKQTAKLIAEIKKDAH